MFVLTGCTAHSDFRLRKLLRQIQQDIPAVDGISSCFVHIIDCDDVLDNTQSMVLEQLLGYGDSPGSKDELGPFGVFRLVVPRPGTISPANCSPLDTRCEVSRLR